MYLPNGQMVPPCSTVFYISSGWGKADAADAVRILLNPPPEPKARNMGTAWNSLRTAANMVIV